ncbi:MAG TPA: DUF4175 domain-containing protein [Polyangiaceae bacterium]|nr:DUF4175 domain-containing protein [Polyangiaceae bacterium]
MDPVAALDRHANAWRTRVAPALRVAFWGALFAAVVVAGALGRRGTGEARLAALGVVVLVVVGFAARAWVERRGLLRQDRMVRRLILSEDRLLGEKVLRALELKERAEHDPSVGSAELVGVHLARTVARIPEGLVVRRGERSARRFRLVALALSLLGLVAVGLDPPRAVEGLDVLLARHGTAPLDMVWLEGLTLVVQPPPYLRTPEHHLDPLGGEAPEGSTLIVRGTPARPGRRLVLTDGAHEVPFVTDGSDGVVARFTLDRDLTLRVAARFGDVLVREPVPMPVSAVPDAVPLVVLHGAPERIELEKIERLDLSYVAADDHGLREIDLVLRSGGREDRRVLEKLDGQARVEQGSQGLDVSDPFLRRVFLPVSVTIEARDNDELEGGRWGASAAITLVPPAIGAVEAARYKLVAEARGAVVDLLAWLVDPPANADPKSLEKELPNRRHDAANALRTATEHKPGGQGVPAGLASFLLGQARRLEEAKPNGATPAARTEEVVLAVDGAARSLSARDAQSVAKRLGDAAEEAADGYSEAQNPEKVKRGTERADLALGVLDVGAGNLLALEGLGADLGSVTRGELRRIRRAVSEKSFLHAELAARHLAARLRRPNPSFASGGGGVEGGEHGAPRPPSEPPSQADKRFDELAQELEDLTREHAALIDQVEHELEDADEAAKTDDLRRQAAEHAEALRLAVQDLPHSGAREGSGRAAAGLARDHAEAMAEGLERLELGGATESGKTARGLLDEAQKKALAPETSADLQDQGALDRARTAVEKELAWADQLKQRLEQDARERAKSKLDEDADRERSIERRLGEMGQRARQTEAALPETSLEQLDKARDAMKSAASDLAGGQGEQGLDGQREAQRLLEQGGAERTTEDSGGQAREGREPSHGRGGKGMDTRAPVPGADDQHRALEFRKRVLEGLGQDRGGRLDPAIRRYAEGLLE